MSPTAMRVGVLGSVNEDSVVQADGSVSGDLGGVLFTAGALAILGQDQQIEPWLLTRIGSPQMEKVQTRMSAFPTLQLGVVETCDGAGYHCQIEYDADGAKQERLLGDVPPLTIRDVACHLRGLHALVVNFITGYELELATLQAIRRVLKGQIVMDLHSLTLARDTEGRRSQRTLPRWRAWVGCADVLQMNEQEAASLGARGGLEGAVEFARTLLSFGPMAVVVTLSTRGAVGAWRDPAGFVRSHHQPALEAGDGVVDTTGCGDVFLAGLSADLMKGGSLPSALKLAASAAARKCARPGLAGLECLVPTSMLSQEG